MKTKSVLDRYGNGPKLNLSVSMLDGDEGKPLVQIEGSPDALTFLGKLLVAIARDAARDGFQMAPDGPGSHYFSRKSELGIYLHVPEYCSDFEATQSQRHVAAEGQVSKRRKKKTVRSAGRSE